MKKTSLKSITGGNLKAQDAFVSAGDSQEQEAQKVKTKRLIADIPEDLHNALKVTAFSQGVTIKQYIVIMLQDALEKDED